MAGSADLKVDYELLDSSATTVKGLKGAFDDLPNTMGVQSQDWGSGDISGAMDSFANNWDYRRDILSGKLQEVAEKLEDTIKAFRDADAKLADELEKAMHGDGKQ